MFHTNTTDPDETAEYTQDQRNAMRQYLQRCEVRLSTLHRIALAFVGGAGLLLLIPAFLKDAIDNILVILLTQAGNQFPELSTNNGVLLTLVLYGTLLYPLLLSLAIPLYGVYLLLRDIVKFYFTIYMPGFPADLLNPSFALTGLNFWPDESPRLKRDIMRFQYQHDHIDFTIPFSENWREHYFDTIIEETQGGIIPTTRNLSQLEALDVLPPDIDKKNVLRFNTAMGLARSLDRTLMEDVALTEMSLVRHVMYLRRLVLRYVKTLLMLIWTTMIAFLMLPLLQTDFFPVFIVLSVGYLVWSIGVMPVMLMPLHWSYRHRGGNHRLQRHIDPQLRLLETRVQPLCRLATISALIAVLLSIAAYYVA